MQVLFKMSLAVSSVISSLNLSSPLPSIFELVVCNHLETGLYHFLEYAHLTLCGRSALVARTARFSKEIYLLLMLAVQKHFIWETETSFCELVMGLVRAGVAEKPLAFYSRAPFLAHARRIPSPRFFGPPPSLSAEECMLTPSILQSSRLAGREGTVRTSATGTSSSDINPITAEGSLMSSLSSTYSDPLEDSPVSTSEEQMLADRSLYGHLRFTKLSQRQKIISLLVTTVIPYLLRHAEAWHAEQVDPTLDAVDRRAAFARAHPLKAKVYAVLAKYVYPFFYVGWESLNFLFVFFYALELTPYTCLIHRLSHLAVRRLQSSDRAVSPKTSRLLLFVRVTMMLFYYSTLFVQWTSRQQNHNAGESSGRLNNAANLDLQSMPVPPPPVFGVNTNLPSDAEPPTPGECPLCHKEIMNATVLTVSGILGCYVCLHEYVQENKKCPVTKQPCSLLQLRRIIKS